MPWELLDPRLQDSLSDLGERVIVETIFTRDERYLNFDLLAPETRESR